MGLNYKCFKPTFRVSAGDKNDAFRVYHLPYSCLLILKQYGEMQQA